MYAQIVNTKYAKNNGYIGSIYKVRGEKVDIMGEECFMFEGTPKIFKKSDCIILSNVLEFKKRSRQNVQKKKKRQ